MTPFQNLRGGKMNNLKPVRINTRISTRQNEWLDQKSAEMGISKSALVAVAVENYMREQTVVNDMPKLMQLVQEYEQKNM